MNSTALTSPASLAPAATGNMNPQQLGQIKNAAAEFEAVFLSEMMSHMFEGIQTDKMFGGGAGEDMFRGMMVQEYGKQMSKNHSVGIAAQMQKTMIEMQQF